MQVSPAAGRGTHRAGVEVAAGAFFVAVAMANRLSTLLNEDVARGARRAKAQGTYN